MMRSSLFLAFLSLGALPACMSDGATDDDIHLPGDIDDAPAGGKGDAWNADNDPTNLATHLTYKLSSLPKDGKLDKPVWKDRFPVQSGDEPIWADTYWPTVEGSTNTRWVNASTKSPLEKYDAAFNNAAGCATQPATRCGSGAKAAWDKYLACAGPAAKWQAVSFQGALEMYDGLDNDKDGKIDECDDNDGIAGWWGLCHAWTPASLLEPEPRHAVTYNGQKFEVSDIKALMLTLYDKTDAVMLGGRCNATTIDHDATGTATDTDCKDVNAGALHVILTNFLGLHDQALIEDRTANAEVWNQPVYGYHVSMQQKVTASRAMACIGATGSTYTPNSKATSLYEVKTTVQYIYEGYPSTSPLGMRDNIGTDTYHYILEIGSTGKIIGGEYCTESKDSHPDFLWSPKAVSTSSYGRNPGVDLDKVRMLLQLSRGTDGGGGTTTGASFQNTTATSIPDNDPAGASVDVAVDRAVTFTSLSVAVDIKHTYRGDLTVSLLHDGALVKTLVDQAGGSADDIVDTYALTTGEAGTASKGTWTLKVVDNAAEDVGTINSVKLTFSN
ncbi:MAG TPA: proprotein convertase P-domain-containing protein [Kofleriaceae bacterium]|nr:proprotein convertase P-domain-containing protein [Kofleriaceae bacterium]